MKIFIEKIQNRIEAIYDIFIPERASDFLIDKKEAQNLLSNPASLPQEVLLVRHADHQNVEVALFLDSDLIQNLQTHNPFLSLSRKNFYHFCTAVEGVSHFVYFLWKAYGKKQLTQLEMELQAEIDKFILLYFQASSSHKQNAQSLLDRLFEDFHLMENLSEEHDERYLTASRLASQYCYQLTLRFGAGIITQKLLEEIRHFYHLAQNQKIQHILH